MLKLSSFLFYILCICVSFFLGLMFAGWIEAGKGQMLAGGAIVLGYGAVGAGIGLLLSLIGTYNLQKKHIVTGNIILAILFAIMILFFKIKHDRRQEAKKDVGAKIEKVDNVQGTS